VVEAALVCPCTGNKDARPDLVSQAGAFQLPKRLLVNLRSRADNAKWISHFGVEFLFVVIADAANKNEPGSDREC